MHCFGNGFRGDGWRLIVIIHFWAGKISWQTYVGHDECRLARAANIKSCITFFHDACYLSNEIRQLPEQGIAADPCRPNDPEVSTAHLYREEARISDNGQLRPLALHEL